MGGVAKDKDGLLATEPELTNVYSSPRTPQLENVKHTKVPKVTC